MPSLFKNFVYDLMNQPAAEAKDKADEQKKTYHVQKAIFSNARLNYDAALKRSSELQNQITHYQSRIHTLTKEEDELFMRIRSEYRVVSQELQQQLGNVASAQYDLDNIREIHEEQRETYYSAEHRSNQAHKTLNKYFAVLNALVMISWYLYNRNGHKNYTTMLSEIQKLREDMSLSKEKNTNIETASVSDDNNLVFAKFDELIKSVEEFKQQKAKSEKHTDYYFYGFITISVQIFLMFLFKMFK
ncbi:laminin subunit beta-1 [Acrasis kona]|uniref:Laminin subunit beta-1 n=1 Tax=Acrasis kona TaxID=1008807 RepID=A0AAW2ZL20_9EUKA